MKNYYQILDIEIDADSKEIRKAYKKMLRKHPPEKDEEGFKKIREAYETLSDEKSRAEYDAIIKYKDEIEEYMISGQVAMEEENYMEAVRWFKKILVIEPSMSYARNMIGLAYGYNGDYRQAIEQFKRIVEENPKNPTYLYNLGMAHMELKNYRLAKDYLTKAYQENKINPQIVIALADININERQYDDAVRLLREAIELDGEIDFQDQMFFFKLIEVYIFKGDIDQAEKVLEEIEDIIPDDEEIHNYVVWRVSKLAAELYDLKAFEFSRSLSKWALQMDPGNQVIRDLYNAANEIMGIYRQFEKFNNDNNIVEPLKGIVSIWIPNDLSENQKKEYFNNLLQQLEYHYNEEILSSIRRMESLYRMLFKLNPKFFKELKIAVGGSSSSSSSSRTHSTGSNVGGKYSSDRNVNTDHYETSVSSGSGNCFVATAAYGTPWAEEINILRKWRDEELSLTFTGSLFISLYNKIGPHAANIIRDNKFLMSVTRLLIKGVIKVINKRVR